MLSIFSCAQLPSVYTLWWGICPHLLPVFLIGLFVFLLLNFKSSFYVLYTSPLSDMGLANIFPGYTNYLFILLTVSFTEQSKGFFCCVLFCFVHCNEVQASNFFFHGCAFGVVPKNSSPNPRSHRFFSCVFLWKVYTFTFHTSFCGSFGVIFCIRSEDGAWVHCSKLLLKVSIELSLHFRWFCWRFWNGCPFPLYIASVL